MQVSLLHDLFSLQPNSLNLWMLARWDTLDTLYPYGTAAITYLHMGMLSQIIHLGWYLIGCGLFGLAFTAENLLLGMFCLEISAIGGAFLFLAYGLITLNYASYIGILVIIVLAGAESALGLALVMRIYQKTSTVAFEDFTRLRG